jgi:superoxide dismutase, Cu-Zn family
MSSLRRSAALLAGPALVVLLATSAAAGPAASRHAHGAFASAANPSGPSIGWVKLTEDRNGVVHVNVKVEGLTAGLHGIHIHTTGSCAPTFAAAGGHYNPMAHEHGLDNPNGPHAGDLPNLVVDVDGDGTLNARTDRATIAELLAGDGTAFIIHANQDTQTTTPGENGPGNSGARIACAVVQAD